MTDPGPQSSIPPRREAGSGRWRLRARDLPAENVVREAPELEGLRENSVYRAMVLGSRSGSLWARLPSLVRGPVIGLGLVCVFLASMLLLPFLVLLVVLSRLRPPEPEAFFRIPSSLLTDLLQAPLPSRDWTLAFWARGTKPSGMPSAPSAVLTVVTLCYLAGLMIFLLMGPIRPSSRAVVYGVGGLLGGCLPFLTHASATAPLPYLVRRLRLFGRELRQRGKPPVILGNTFVRMSGGLLVLFFAWMGLRGFFRLLFFFESFTAPSLRLLSHPAAPYVCLAAGYLVALATGVLWRRFVFRNRHVYLDRMDREMETVLEHLKYRNDEVSAGAGGRALSSHPAEGGAPASLTSIPGAG